MLGVERFFRGAVFAWEGLRFVGRARLWPYIWAPIAVSGVVTAVLLGATVWGLLAWGPTLEPVATRGWTSWALWVVYTVSLWALGLAAVVVLSLLVHSVVLSLFQDQLKSRVWRLLERSEQGVAVGVLEQGVRAVWMSLALAACVLVAFLVSWVPALGPPVGAALGWYATAYWLGRQVMEFPWGHLGRSELNKKVHAFRPEILGVGTPLLLVGWIPVVGATVFCFAVVGALMWEQTLAQRHGTH